MIINRAYIRTNDPIATFCGYCGRPLRICQRSCRPQVVQLTARGAVRDLIVDYLERVKDERTVGAIIRYMFVRYMFVMHRVNPSATRTTLSRLKQEGKIRRIGHGRYERQPAGDDHNPQSN